MSTEKLASLSGDAGDVLYSLFFRGALQSGDIPSKAGANELREAGLIHTQHTSTWFGGEDYFTFLTAEGQRFAIGYLAETNFGKVKDKPSMDELRGMQEVIADSLDDMKEQCVKAWDLPVEGKTPVIFLLDRYVTIGGQYTPDEIRAAVEHIQGVRAAEAFSKAAKKVSPFAIKDGEVFIEDAFIGNGITTANWSMKVNVDENGHRYAAGVGIAVNNEANKIRLTDDMREAVIDAMRESDVFKALQASQDAQASALVTTQLAIEQAANDAIRNALKPGGQLFGNR